LSQLQKYLESAFTKRFACPTPGDVEAKWETLKDIVCDATMEHLKNVSCKHKGWFLENNAKLQQLMGHFT